MEPSVFFHWTGHFESKEETGIFQQPEVEQNLCRPPMRFADAVVEQNLTPNTKQTTHTAPKIIEWNFESLILGYGTFLSNN